MSDSFILIIIFIIIFTSLSFLIVLLRDYIYKQRKILLQSVLIMHGYKYTKNATHTFLEKNNIYFIFVNNSLVLIISEGNCAVHVCTIFISVEKLLSKKLPIKEM